mmetsp:Transcript_10846/g.32970  ORF Transcript_10846/g.32970 Transcript_10846/m.32970 type:complete len:154 (+) Transcript_10846:966-1427(+)
MESRQLPGFLGGDNPEITFDALGEDPDIALPVDSATVKRFCDELLSEGTSPRARISAAEEKSFSDAAGKGGSGSQTRTTQEVITAWSVLAWAVRTLLSHVMFAFATAYTALKFANAFFFGPLRDMVAAMVLVVFAWSLPGAVNKSVSVEKRSG